jgi:hypothetical protein
MAPAALTLVIMGVAVELMVCVLTVLHQHPSPLPFCPLVPTSCTFLMYMLVH